MAPDLPTVQANRDPLRTLLQAKDQLKSLTHTTHQASVMLPPSPMSNLSAELVLIPAEPAHIPADPANIPVEEAHTLVEKFSEATATTNLVVLLLLTVLVVTNRSHLDHLPITTKATKAVASAMKLLATQVVDQVTLRSQAALNFLILQASVRDLAVMLSAHLMLTYSAARTAVTVISTHHRTPATLNQAVAAPRFTVDTAVLAVLVQVPVVIVHLLWAVAKADTIAEL